MHFKFLQSAHISGRDYARGVHDVSETVQYDPYFLKLVGAGLIVEVEASKVISPESQKERSEKLLNKLMAKKAGVPSEVETEKPVAPDHPVEPKDDEKHDKSEKHDKKKKG